MNKAQHYEDFYQSTVFCLERIRGKVVGSEQKSHDGVRFRLVDGVPATDDAIFELAWGRETADHVRVIWKP